jgi:RimJ/RimL family protein N-acetyltransferase
LTQGKLTAIGYALLPNERGKGYGSEAVKIIVDYLFLSKNMVRIQAENSS